MDTSIVVLRVLHIVTGVYWAGALFFAATFLINVVMDTGPAGGQVMAALIRRRYFDVVPLVALVTIVSGFWLYYRVSGHFDPVWMGSRTGMALGVGAVAGVVALLVGVLVARPATLGAGGLMAKAMALPEGAERATMLVGVNTLRMRGIKATRVVALVLLVTVLCMSVARYI